MRLGSKNQLYILLLFATLLSSCSNQESWAYKEWHNTLAHYNTFFNAEQKWLETVETTREGYKDDFRKPISLINYGTIDILKGNQAAMDEVIKKASTMIDKHPRSKWVDDAYLLELVAFTKQYFAADFSETGTFWAKVRIAYEHWYSNANPDSYTEHGLRGFSTEWRCGGPFLIEQIAKSTKLKTPSYVPTNGFTVAKKDLW